MISPPSAAAATSGAPQDDIESWTSLVDLALRDVNVMSLSEYVRLYASTDPYPSPSPDSDPAPVRDSEKTETAVEDEQAKEVDKPKEEAETRDVNKREELSYFKVTGKARYKPVVLEEGKSSVSQLFEMASHLGVAAPVFSSVGLHHGTTKQLKHFVKLQFLHRTWTDDEGADSIKQGKHRVAAVALQDILNLRSGTGVSDG